MVDDLALLEAQQDVHELIAQQAPLENTLEAIADWIDALLPGAVMAFMRFDPAKRTLSLLSSTRFSRRYQQRLQDIAVGPKAGSFGAAAYYRQLVITEDIQTDPRWSHLRRDALAEDLHACWSSPVLTAQGELLGTFGTYFRESLAPADTSKRRLRQAAALIALAIVRDRDSRHHRTLAEWHHSLFVNHPDGVYEFDLEGRFQRGNAALERISGYAEQELIGRHFNEFIDADYRKLTQEAFDAARAGHSRHYETIGTHAQGHTYHLEVTNFPVTIEGSIVGVYGICRDITQHRRQEAQIAYQATHDLLTGLPNQALLDSRLREAFAQRRPSRPLVVMYLNLDGFKAINDGLGHPVGNQLLVTVAERLRERQGPGDTLARITGDEFALLMPNLAYRDEATALARRILEAFEMPIEIEGRALHITTSIGIACADDDTQRAHELLQHADLALEEAKRQGRNTWQWYQGHARQSTNEHVLLRHDLQAALREGQFELYYQPIVEAVSGRVRSVEALVRWHHPDQGMISPGVFIPLAEKTGQIIALGRWVLRHACQSLADRRAKGERVFPVAVNISSLQFRREGFLEEVNAILEDTGLPPELLELEMTESILLGGAQQAIALIGKLRELGITIAIDDFGTGFSSLSYLRDLPIHKVKLDRAFIQDILTSPRNAAIVQGIITMAHHMDLQVVAEGIEERAQQRDLDRRQCDLLQGFFFARPMPWDALVALPDMLPVAARTSRHGENAT